MDRGHDCFRWAGLGQTGADVWRALLVAGDTGITDAHIAEATGRGRATVARKLRAMYRLGMVAPLGDGLWRAIANVDLDKIAQELGTSGMGEAQCKLHSKDRLRHRTVLAVGRKR